MKYSASKENHLKAIFHLQQEQGLVTTNALAAALQTRPASVTDMLKKLKEQKLLIYERYKGFKLNNEGRKAAVQVIRKHRLWEYFLVKKLQFGWEEVHEIAEELEHISSRALIDRLDAFLARVNPRNVRRAHNATRRRRIATVSRHSSHHLLSKLPLLEPAPPPPTPCGEALP